MKKFLAFFMPIFGAIYLSAYIRSAMLDVVYTDYIRIINTYLKDPFSPKPYFGKDILTRLPITYFERMINIAFLNIQQCLIWLWELYSFRLWES